MEAGGLTRVVDAEPMSQHPEGRPGPPSLIDVLTIALLFGLVAGALEPIGLLTGVTNTAEGHLSLGAYLWWMPAAADLFTFGLLGLIGWGLARLLPGRVSLKLLLGILAALCAMASLRVLDGHLGVVTVDLVALGIAVQFTQRLGDGLLRSLTPVRLVLGAAVLALVAVAIGIEQSRTRAERRTLATLPVASRGAPNILLLVLDTVRAMNLSAYGYARKTTPNLEALASRGTLFERVISAAPWTRPAHASLFTGQWEHDHTADHTTPLDGRYLTLAEEFDRLGYRTGGFVANLTHTTRTSGIPRGFAHYEDHLISIPQILVAAVMPRAVYRALQEHLRIPETRVNYRRKSAAEVNHNLVTWLDQSGEAPFFAFANYMDAHTVYDPRPPFDTAFSAPAYPDPLPTRGTGHGIDRTQKMRPYDQAIATIDNDIAQLLRALDERGLLENTIVVVTADHGEAFGEHGIYGHGATLYLTMLQVPLVISWPGHVPEGLRVPDWVSTRALAATLVHLASPETPEPFPGLPLTRFWEDSSAQSETLYAGSGFMANNPPWYPTSKGNIYGILDRGLMLIREADGHRELYQPTSDPWMQHDLQGAPDEDSSVARLGGTLEHAVGPAVVHPGYSPIAAAAALNH
jgi:arylsulfatase A-like enzyme